MKTILFLVVVLIGICAWCPWITPEQAQAVIEKQFDPAFRATRPLYSGACTLESLTDLHKVYFGYDATVVYNCDISGHGTAKVTYSFYTTVSGIPSE